MFFWDHNWLIGVLVLVICLVSASLVTPIRHIKAKDPYRLGLRPLSRRGSVSDEDPPALNSQDENLGSKDEFDVVAIHGLGADPEYSWSVNSGNGKRISWLKERKLLPGKFPNAQMLAFNHTADWLYYHPTITASRSAEELLEELKERQLSGLHRPIILIGHSYGGNIVKDAIRKAREERKYKDVLQAIAGIIFLGTPHFGSPISSITAHFARLMALFLGSSDLVLKSLRKDDPALLDVHKSFIHICSRDAPELDLWRTSVCFYEKYDTYIMFNLISIGPVVGAISACAGGQANSLEWGFSKNHTGLNKISDPQDLDFKRICRAIKAFAEGPRASRYRSLQHISAVTKAAKTILSEESFMPTADASSDTASKQFIKSEQYQDWMRLRAHADPEYHSQKGFLWFVTTPEVNTSEAMRVIAGELRNNRHDDSFPIDTAVFAPAVLNNREPLETWMIMRIVIAQLVHGNTSRLEMLNKKGLETISTVLQSSLELSGRVYWNLLSDLLVAKDELVTIVIDRLDLIPQDHRDRFLAELITLWNSLKGKACLKILVTSHPFDDVEQRLHQVRRFDARKYLLDMLDSLKRNARNIRFEHVMKGYRKTGDWFLSSSRFAKFQRDKQSQIFWIHGLPGSGKSTLLKTVLGRISETSTSASRRQRTLVASFFYNDDIGEKAETSHKVMLLSLLYQMLQQEHSLIQIFSARKMNINVRAWEWSTMEELFRDLCNWSIFPITIYLGIDALNESDVEAPDFTRKNILDLFATLAKSKQARVIWKIIITTRDLEIPLPSLDDSSSIRLHEQNKDDLKRVINRGIRAVQDKVDSLSLRCPLPLSKFKNDVRENSGGVILWAKLVLEMVEKELTTMSKNDFVDLSRHLDGLPKGLEKLEKLYIKMVELLRAKNNITESKEWLHWGALANRNLKVNEFIDALSLCPSRSKEAIKIQNMAEARLLVSDSVPGIRNALAERGGGFLELKVPQESSTASLHNKVTHVKKARKDAVIQLAHVTVKVFLMKPEAIPFQLSERDGHTLIAQTCIEYLQLALGFRTAGITPKANSEDFLKHLDDLPFLSYVFQNLPLHLQALASQKEEAQEQRTAKLVIRQLVQDEGPECHSLLYVWTRAWLDKTTFPPFWTNYVELVPGDAPESGKDSAEPFEWLLLDAAKKSFPIGLHILLSTGRLNAPTLESSRLQQELLKYAATGTNVETNIGILEEFGIRQPSVNPFSEDLDVFTLFTEENVKVSSPRSSDDERSSPSAEYGEKHDFRDPHNSHDSNGYALTTWPTRDSSRTSTYQALHAAAESGSLAGVLNLLRDDPRPDARDAVGKSPLHFAASNGSSAVVEALIKAGADLNARDLFGRTPLSNAVMSGQEHAVKLLLDRGANPVVEDIEGRDPLSMADEKQHEGIRQLLADKLADGGANPSTLTGKPRLPFKGLTTLPILPSPHFVSREGILSQLYQAFEIDSVQSVALAGLGGTGKTQLAVAYARRTQEQDPETKIIWVDSSSASRIQSSCQYFARRASLLKHHDSSEDVVAFVLKWLNSSTSGKWVLIVDNIDNDHLLQNLVLPNNPLGRIILTTRNRALSNFWGRVISIPSLSDEEGHQMLENYLGMHLSDLQTREILRDLGHLPLAIAQAAAFIRETNISVYEYMEMFEEVESTTAQLMDKEFEDHRGPWGLPNSLSRAWAISFNQIQKQNNDAGNLLALLSVLDSSDCPKSLLESLTTLDSLEEAIRLCLQFSFIQQNEQGSLEMHSLVRTATNEWLRGRNELQKWQHHALVLISESFPRAPAFDQMNECVALLPHVDAVLEYDSDFEGGLEARQILLEGTAACYLSLGRLDKAEDLEQEALDIKLQAFGESNCDTRTSMDNLVNIYQSQGRWQEAETLALRVLEVRKKLLDANDPEIMISSRRLALVYLGQGRWQESEKVLLDALSTELRLPPPRQHDPDTLSTTNNLAALYGVMGRLEEAEKLQIRIMDERKKVLGQTHPLTLNSISNLSSTYRAQRQWEKAEQFDFVAINTAERVLGEEHPDTLIFMSKLVATLRGQLRYKEAEHWAQRVFEARKKCLGDEHPDTLASLDELASTIWDLGRWKEAAGLMRQVMESQKTVLGEYHPVTITSLASLASAIAFDHPEEAEAIEVRVWKMRRQLLGEDHPETQKSKHNLAAAKESKRRVDRVKLRRTRSEGRS